MNPRILLVNDEPATAWAIQRALRHEPLEVITAANVMEARSRLDKELVDVVITDQRLPGEQGEAFLPWLTQEHPHSIRLMVAGQHDLLSVVDAFNHGRIYKFIVRPWANDTLRLIVQDAVNRAREGKVDQRTGWLNYRTFCTELDRVLATRPVKVVIGEIRNATTIWSLLDANQRRQLASRVADRCVAVAGKPLVPHASLERNLFAFALDREFNDENLDGLFDHLQAPYTLDAKAVTLQLDFGVAPSSTGDDEGAAIVRRAMEALTSLTPDAPRRVGRWKGETTSSLHQLHSLERDMVRAVARNEFFVQIQPQVSAQDFLIVGGETLIR